MSHHENAEIIQLSEPRTDNDFASFDNESAVRIRAQLFRANEMQGNRRIFEVNGTPVHKGNNSQTIRQFTTIIIAWISRSYRRIQGDSITAIPTHKRHTSIKHLSPLLLIIFLLPLISSCGGGGGGGGGGGTSGPDNTGPTVNIVSPTATSFPANPDSLPASVSFSYSDSSGILASSSIGKFLFRGVEFDFSSYISQGASTASTSGTGTSPLYWSVISAFDGNLNFTGYINVFAVSNASTGRYDLIDIDTGNNTLIVAAPERKILIFKNASTGASIREVSLSEKPIMLQVCPAYGKVYVAFENSSSLSSYNTSTGISAGLVTLPQTPYSMTINRTASKAYVIFNDTSNTLTSFNCANNTVSTVYLSNMPQRITTDGQMTDRLFFSGGVGLTKGVYKYQNGVETKIFSIDSLPVSLSYESSRDRLFMAYFDDTISVYNPNTGALIQDLTVGDQTFSVDSDPSASRTFSLSKDSDTVSVISGATPAVTNTLPLSFNPVGMAIDSVNSKLFVLQNIWDITSNTSGVLTVSIKDQNENSGSKSVTLNITPVSIGDIESPNPPPD